MLKQKHICLKIREEIVKPSGTLPVTGTSSPHFSRLCRRDALVARGFAISSIVKFLLISAMLVVPAYASGAEASFSEILQAVQKNIDLLKKQMVDLVSSEEIIIEEFNDRGKTTKTTNIISTYRVFPGKTSAIYDCHVVYEILESLMPVGILREERDLLSVRENNRTQRIDRFNLTEHFWAKGSSYVELLTLFDKQNEKCFDYRLRATGEISGRSFYEIGIKQKEADIGEINTTRDEKISWNVTYEGLALIDAATMEVFQLNRGAVGINYYGKTETIIQPPGSVVAGMRVKVPYVNRYVVITEYEYDRIKVGEQTLTLPVAKNVRCFRENGQLVIAYKYHFSDYQVYEVSTKITFGAADESLNE